MVRAESVKFELNRYHGDSQKFENDLVAQLPGLLITQFAIADGTSRVRQDRLGLRFDFVDDWYNVLAFLDGDKNPTGHYTVALQTPLRNDEGVWKGCDLLLGLEIVPGRDYAILGEEEFFSAVQEGWMRVYAAAKARETLRKLCLMLDEGRLPQEVMDAVGR